MRASTNARFAFCLLLLCSLAGCAATSRGRTGNPGDPGVAVINNYFAALNRRDLLVLTAYVDPDVEWFSMMNGERLLEVSGRDALTATLRTFFAKNAHTEWSIESASAVGDHIAIRERLQWQENGTGGERVSLCTFELRAGRIRRITKFLE